MNTSVGFYFYNVGFLIEITSTPQNVFFSPVAYYWTGFQHRHLDDTLSQ